MMIDYDQLKAIDDWIEACPFACESYKDKEGNIVITVIAEDAE